jgi:hypothetical protein
MTVLLNKMKESIIANAVGEVGGRLKKINILKREINLLNNKTQKLQLLLKLFFHFQQNI